MRDSGLDSQGVACLDRRNARWRCAVLGQIARRYLLQRQALRPASSAASDADAHVPFMILPSMISLERGPSHTVTPHAPWHRSVSIIWILDFGFV
jgi:hypothetical protein